MGSDKFDWMLGSGKVDTRGHHLWDERESPDEESTIAEEPKPSYPDRTERKFRHNRRRYNSKLAAPPTFELQENNAQNIHCDEKGKWPSLPGLFLEPVPPPPPPIVHLINLQTRNCWSESKKKLPSKINNIEKVTHDAVEFLVDLSELDEEQTSFKRAHLEDFCRPIAGNLIGCNESHSKISLETVYLDDFGKMEGMKFEKGKLLKELSGMNISSPLLDYFKEKNTVKRSKTPAVLKQTSFSPKRFFKRKMVKWYDSNIPLVDKVHSFVKPTIEEKGDGDEVEQRGTEGEHVQKDDKLTLGNKTSEKKLPLTLNPDSQEDANSQSKRPAQPVASPVILAGTTFNEEPPNKSDYDIPSDHNKTATRNGLPVIKTELILVRPALFTNFGNRFGAKTFA